MSLAIWIEASRPKTLPIGLSPLIIASAEAIRTGKFSGVICILLTLAALLFQIGANLANDYYDYLQGADTDERKGFRRAAQSGLIKMHHLKWAFLLCFGLGLCSALVLMIKGGWVVVATGLLFTLGGLFYTKGSRSLAYLGLGELCVFLFFGPVATLLSLHLYGVETVFWPILPIGGLLGCGMLCLNNLRDVEEDRKAGKKTLIVRFGVKFGKIEYTTIFLLLALLSVFYFPIPLLLFGLLPLNEVWNYLYSEQLNRTFVKTARFTLFYTVCMFLQLIIR